MSEKNFIITVTITRNSILEKFERDIEAYENIAKILHRYDGNVDHSISIDGLESINHVSFERRDQAENYLKECATTLEGIKAVYINQNKKIKITKNY